MKPALRMSLVAAAALAIVLAVSACTGSKHKGSGPSTTSSTVAIPSLTTPPAPTSVPTYPQYPVPASVANDPGKHKQVQVNSCASTGTSAAASGSVHNTGTRSASYDITVFFTSDTATAVDYATTSVKVDAGATTKFTAQRTFAAPSTILCVLVGVS